MIAFEAIELTKTCYFCRFEPFWGPKYNTPTLHFSPLRPTQSSFTTYAGDKSRQPFKLHNSPTPLSVRQLHYPLSSPLASLVC